MLVTLINFMAYPAAAHPHVWVTTVTRFIVAKGAVTGIRVEWAFDEFYSSSLIEDYTDHHDVKFDAKDVAALKKGAFQRTAGQNYFTFIKVDGKLLTDLIPSEFNATVVKGIVHYQFLLPLRAPVDPRRHPLTVTYYEESYYVDVTPEAAHIEGDGSLVCKTTIAEDPNTTIYFGMVKPMMVTLHC
ncbi:MAG: DUF1007 family protein [Alphaproteobacteria bacterium]|nr:DUF1007 family protein [Alphaproteobacteria bacterium]